jgi:transcriptional regulator with XRE-family HTH domain
MYKLSILERINIALERSDRSQRDLARLMGLSPSGVNKMLSKDVDSIKYLKAVEELTGYRFEWLRTGSGPEKLDTETNEIDALTLGYLKDKLRTKDDLIEEQRGRIADQKKLIEVLERLTKKKG